MDDRRERARTTPRAVAAEAQSRGQPAVVPALTANAESAGPAGGLETRFRLGPNVDRVIAPPESRGGNEPLYRPLRIYAIDPAASRLEGAVTTINVPYERLEPGPVGRRFAVDNRDGAVGVAYRRVDLDDPALLIRDGQDPTPSDPRFHQQMVYAVCSNVYAMFKRALGRELTWGFERPTDRHLLYLRPHAFRQANAHYDKGAGALCFGYDEAPRTGATDRTLPGGFVFACLSHDVIAHELTHAVLDGLRATFTVPSGPDVLAFHEAFADLIALFAHFSYPELVAKAIRDSRGTLRQPNGLASIARQLGQVLGNVRALRCAVDGEPGATRRIYDPELAPHDLGGVLVAAVFEAYLTVFERKTARLLRVATGGSGVLPAGALSADLEYLLASKAAQLAEQFLAMIIRAIDYCPPVDLRFGEFLRALITADHDLVPEDKGAYREALIDAFLQRRIYPRHVSSLSEDALLWRPPSQAFGPVSELAFAHLRAQGQPGSSSPASELRRRAIALGAFVSQPDRLASFGLVSPDDARRAGCTVDLPTVESVRMARRVGPDGQIAFDTVAEIIQRCTIPRRGDDPGFDCYGGATVILGSQGEIRYSISKSVLGQGRIERRRRFIESRAGHRLWAKDKGRYVPRPHLFQALHGH